MVNWRRATLFLTKRDVQSGQAQWFLTGALHLPIRFESTVLSSALRAHVSHLISGISVGRHFSFFFVQADIRGGAGIRLTVPGFSLLGLFCS